MKKIALFMAIGALFLTACTDFKDKKVGDLSDKQKQGTHKELTAEENKLLQNYFARKGDGSLTVIDAIDSQKSWEDDRAKAQEQERITAKKLEEEKIAAQKIAEQAKATMNKIISIKMTAKELQSIDVKRRMVPHNVFYFDVTNNSNKDVSKYKTILTISNKQGQVLNKTILERNIALGVHQTIKESFAIESSRSNISDVVIEQTPLEELNFQFDFDSIGFTDGDKLEILK